MKLDLVLPMSAKAENSIYSEAFKGIPTGFFYNSNDFASAISLVMIFAFTFLSFTKSNKRWIILFLSAMILLFTGSRGALVSLLFYRWLFLYQLEEIGRG
ncbi:hypothetical protein EW093_13145 [Thiospirochaeta perfilievii]|uniref:Uncharacterized protein n=1 Tax=Thiospirochaeta perfilievii TaxID=252967 RepID=A0A5C1QGE0_9SPIO|nr:hypothetical protein [Thiospirochaeta perfilievii]QEN05616.1 hypothetical protein EW093_13145 [Thiospirochaeta perfilievii]